MTVIPYEVHIKGTSKVVKVFASSFVAAAEIAVQKADGGDVNWAANSSTVHVKVALGSEERFFTINCQTVTDYYANEDEEGMIEERWEETYNGQ